MPSPIGSDSARFNNSYVDIMSTLQPSVKESAKGDMSTKRVHVLLYMSTNCSQPPSQGPRPQQHDIQPPSSPKPASSARAAPTRAAPAAPAARHPAAAAGALARRGRAPGGAGRK